MGGMGMVEVLERKVEEGSVVTVAPESKTGKTTGEEATAFFAL